MKIKRIIFGLIFCLIGLISFGQKSKILLTTPEFEISSYSVQCDYSWYESIQIKNLTNDTINIEFDVESYWNTNPNLATLDDEHCNIIINPLNSTRGDCNNKILLRWSSSNIIGVRLINIKLINLKYCTL